MNRRRIVVGAALIALTALTAIAATGFVTYGENAGKVTLRSRVLEYENSIKRLTPFPSDQVVEAKIIALMGEYFRIGMSYDECMKILKNNDLTVDEVNTNVRDYRYEEKIYFKPSVVSRINLPTWTPLISFEYRLILRFHNEKLDQFTASRVGTGP